ncbi:hypothetical protein CO683_09555 [Bradyrhizobium ottawaense]|uniref:Uncharacterized protein n=1 Tax=Bradyrhizobium ottawaense TaxID=931866 RepID=A0A2U8PAD3_9BRAD|nr:hypothetical protein CIT37_21600 [Bradyrhizobium ottawaense]MDA9419481.1 hypothetical protein [Bradyrhizobium sp. CCBAU 25360]MDA9480845.1 hypothetical protein [Bradyrhizobium sp. CCBAU 11445]BBO10659.1 hypothetical protein TM102_21290 [Bradyrhizobium sp. TM102]PDT69987.1 hypothetical protein CO683_09555 [Bradyrhizobium ottawaense]
MGGRFRTEVRPLVAEVGYRGVKEVDEVVHSLVPRTQRSAISAFTRVFDTLLRCAAEPEA